MDGRARLRLLLPLLCIAVGCEVQKSENPLAPTIAGPIPGVNITAPVTVDPSSGKKVPADQQPITLVIGNSSSNGPRPLSYLFEVATDNAFTNKVFTREAVTPGSGQTSLRLPDPLATGRTYYWHARAQDGANSSPFSAATPFSVFTPVYLGAPQLKKPSQNETLTSLRPTFSWTNSSRSGPVGAVSYEIEVADNQAFANRFDGWTVAEAGGGSTSTTLRKDGPAGEYFFWHVRGYDSNNQGPWSDTRAFAFPNAGGGGGGGGGSGGGSGDVPCGALNEGCAQQIVFGTGNEYPNLLQVFGSDQQALDAALELLRRMIWHLQKAGFQAGRQRNPSGTISGDKLTVRIGSSWRSYDVMSLGFAGRATTVHFVEVFPANPIPDSGIPD